MCVCDFPDTCGGMGTLTCEGCGGDQCVCRCGGEYPCGGCEDCEDIDEDDFDDGPPVESGRESRSEGQG